MSMQNLMDNFNLDLMKEVNAPRVVKTGTYTAQVLDFETRIDQKTGVEFINLALQLLDETEAKVGRTWLDITTEELRIQSGKMAGKLRSESELCYKLAKILGVKDGESFEAKLGNAVFSVYGEEMYLARNSELPKQLQDPDSSADQWKRIYVKAEGDDAKRDLLLDAEIKPRFNVQRVGSYKG